MSPGKRSSLSIPAKRQRLQRPTSSRAIMEGSSVRGSKQTTRNPSTDTSTMQRQQAPVAQGAKDRSLSSADTEEMKKMKLDGNVSSDTLNAMFENGLRRTHGVDDHDDNDIDDNDSFGVSTLSSKGLPLEEKYPARAKRSSAYFSPSTPERRVISLNGIGAFSEHSPLRKKLDLNLSEIIAEPSSALLGSTTKNDLIRSPKLKSAMKKSLDENRGRQHPSKTNGDATVQNSSTKQGIASSNETINNPRTYPPSKRRNSTSPGRRRRSPSKSTQDRRPSGRHATVSKQRDSSRSITRSASPSKASPSKARRVSPSKKRGDATPKRNISPSRSRHASPSKTRTGSSIERQQSSTMEKIARLLHSPSKLFSPDSKRSSSKIHASDTAKGTNRGRSYINNGIASNKRSSSASP